MFTETAKTASKSLCNSQKWLDAEWNGMKKRRDEYGEGEPEL